MVVCVWDSSCAQDSQTPLTTRCICGSDTVICEAKKFCYENSCHDDARCNYFEHRQNYDLIVSRAAAETFNRTHNSGYGFDNDSCTTILWLK